MAPAHCEIDSPGRNGVTKPMGPEKRSTGTTGPRRKNHMRAYLAEERGIPGAEPRGRMRPFAIRRHIYGMPAAAARA